MRCVRAGWTCWLVLLVPVWTGQAQLPADSSRVDPYGTGAGLQILLTNSGFGLGGYYHRAVGRDLMLLFDFSLGSGKDEREQKFYNALTGASYIQNKANYLLLIPVQFGLQRRLWREQIADNFRPYLQFSIGPTFGWVYPYFRDQNGNNRYDPEIGERIYDVFQALPKGHLRTGVGGMIVLGAYFGRSLQTTQGLRFGYALHYFPRPIQLLEGQATPRRFFGTPVISLTFGRLYGLRR
ncbi:hypothetical protein [Rhodothermus profundi]|uniref:Outer membrane protein beta-barrel domain-containing protein n=1 Tax=Rhodothermus profundi TaxID=633813 RepID=A0A1M6W3C4_9BACT|nr:hypothetical protein [Rhodothermus profundi]SHK88250.1 hypothetical protein SAMN04488087_2224 [Rhodothermus profundi]